MLLNNLSYHPVYHFNYFDVYKRVQGL